MTIGDAVQDVGQVGVRLDVVELGGHDQRTAMRPALGAAIGAGEQMVLAAERNHPVILPISGRRSRSIIAGIRCMDVVSGSTAASSASPAAMSIVEAAPGVVTVVAAWMLDPVTCAGNGDRRAARGGVGAD